MRPYDSELAFAAFIGRVQATPWVLNRERYKLAVSEQLQREYDEVTETNLKFIRGRQVAEHIIHDQRAAEQYMNRKAS